ncbi:MULTISPECIES: sugar ABC transporter substrate-binding protein [Microbacterium]|jgi:ribose transport system substrate-binding protein|uniref:sugar ABC transporter substrate-binding protein n=1 Tax=Microbacterium TaxID=33882 RepID=UPI0023DCA237|nr:MULTISPECIES: sugar ABC transporter substrate-binding protein [Microbacterium]MDF2048150.1 sugar ABC transporter substrate-binding protein [Microbacterium sp. Kw_RZR3]MDF2916434.1 hypothetical protein [Microbacterium sp.]MDQ1075510.1 ABC-type sugar transport system substrate-binding protein [Microbacterium sp. SORGH_AS_0969]MDQ1115748.1 ABC-type sugar transport system substrate-binding protein [Microbacterium testaceum]
MFKKILAFGAIVVAAGVSIVGCAGGAASAGGGDTFKVIAFTQGYGTPVGKSTTDAFVEQAKGLGWDVTLYTNESYDQLNNDVAAAISQGADAVFAGFPDPRQISPIVRAAKDADIPIFSVDGGVEPNADFAIDVTTNQQQIADDTVGALDEAMGGLKGKNVMIIGHDPHIGIMTRSHMAEDLLKAAGANIAGGEIKQILQPGSSQEESLKFVADYLQANPNGLDGVWVGFDHAALGAVQAINEAGRDDIYVTGVDAIGAAVEQIEKGGPFYATVVQPFDEVLGDVVAAMQAYAKDGTRPSENFVEVDVTLVDRANAATITPTDAK